MDKKDLMYKLLNEYVDVSLSISDTIEKYLDGTQPKVEIAKKVKEAYNSLNILSDYVRDYTID